MTAYLLPDIYALDGLRQVSPRVLRLTSSNLSSVSEEQLVVRDKH